MPDDTNPSTVHYRDLTDEIPEQKLDASDDLETLKRKSTPVVDAIFQQLIRERGFTEELENPSTLFIEINERVRYRLPEGADSDFEENLIKAYTTVILEKREEYINIIKAGRFASAIINALNETSTLLKVFGADPVMLLNGQFSHSASDIEIDGAGFGFGFTRFYKNQSRYIGPLGHNWDHNYNLWIRVSEDSQIIARSTGNLREDNFTKHPLFDYWVPPDGENGVINEEGGTFVFRTEDGIRFIYGHPSQELSFVQHVSRLEDRFSNFLAFDYEGDLLVGIHINHEDRIVRFQYDTFRRITEIQDFTGRRWRYAYDDFGDLVSVTGPSTDRYPAGLTTCFEYSSAGFVGELQHNLTRIIDPKNQVHLENEYGADPGLLSFNRVTSQRQGSGERLFEYENVIEEFDFDLGDYERPAHETRVMERNGQVVRHIFNRFGNIIFREEAVLIRGVLKLLRSHYRYNRDGLLVATLSAEGVIAQNLYGREEFVRRHRIESEDDIPSHENLTNIERQGFGRLLATIKRKKYFRIEDLNLARSIWGDIFPDILGAVDLDDDGNTEDVIMKFTYELVFGRLLTQSDPRYTNSVDPFKQNAAQGEHEKYEETLTRYTYEGVEGTENRFLLRIRYPNRTLPNNSEGEPIEESFTFENGTPGYDMNGRLLRYKNPIGTVYTTTYNSAAEGVREGHLKLSLADSEGLAISTRYNVDDLGRVIAVHHPRSDAEMDQRFITRTEYNAINQVTKTISPFPHNFEVRTFYDLNGNVERIERDPKDEKGADVEDAPEVHTFCYDQEFNLTQETMGGAELSTHLVTKHCYNGAGRRVLTVLPNGNRTRNDYDERMLPTSQTMAVGKDDAVATRRDYDDDGRVQRTFDGRGNPTNLTLDAFGRVIAEEDALGNITRGDYDKLGNITLKRVFERRPDGYYLLSRGGTEYDELGQPFRTFADRFSDPQGPIRKEDLTTAFNNSSVPGGKLLITQTFYDAQNRVVKTIDPLGHENTIEYDNLDRLLVQTDPLGNRILNSYDEHSNLIRRDEIELVRDPGDGSVVTGQRVFSTSAAYNELDRLVSVTNPLGRMTEYFYDSRGNQVRVVDPLGNVVQRDYDIYGRCVSDQRQLTESGIGESPVEDIAITNYEYDKNSNLVSVIDALQRITRYRYDTLDRRRTIIYPDNSEFTFDYDPDGNLIRTTDNNGFQRRITVDQLGRTTSVDVDTSGVDAVNEKGAKFERYEYDGLDRPVVEENDFIRCEFRYNSLSWPQRKTTTYKIIDPPLATPFAVTREFDDAGALSELIYPNGRKLQFDRDDMLRLVRIKNLALGTGYPGAETTSEEHEVARFDYAGQQHDRFHFGNGTSASYAYDGAGRLIEINHRSSTETLSKIQYLFDAVGNVRIRNDFMRTRTIKETFSYDSMYRLADEDQHDNPPFNPGPLAPVTVVTPDPIQDRQSEIDALIGSLIIPKRARTYDYDLVGNRNEKRASNEIKYKVNHLDQYTQITDMTSGIVTHPNYDANGNLREDGPYAYTYDSLNRLVEVTQGGTIIAQFFHDVHGRRVMEKVNGITIQLIYNGDNLIAEYRNGKLHAQYVHDGGIDRPVQIASEKHEHWYHTDIVGSVRLLTNRSGSPSATYIYGPFGSLSSSTDDGGIYNPLRYTARRFDAALDMYDYRARQYEPERGRFLQRDPAGMIDGTNPYPYTANNPLSFRDPRGLSSRPEAAPGSFLQSLSTKVFQVRAAIRNIAAGKIPDGYYRLWSGKGTQLEAINLAATEGGWLLDNQLPEFVEAERAFKQAQAIHGQKIPQPLNDKIWGQPSRIYVRRTALAEREWTVSLNNPRSDSVWNQVEKPRIGGIGGAIVVAAKGSGIANIYFALQSDNTFVRVGGVAGGFVETLGGTVYFGGVLAGLTGTEATALQTWGKGLMRYGGGAALAIISADQLYHDIENGNWHDAAVDAGGTSTGLLVLAGSRFAGPVGVVTLGYSGGSYIGNKFVENTNIVDDLSDRGIKVRNRLGGGTIGTIVGGAATLPIVGIGVDGVTWVGAGAVNGVSAAYNYVKFW